MTEPPAKRGYPPIGSSLFAGSWIDSSYSIDLIPSLASLGGEEAILNCGLQHDHEPDAFTASLALTVSWGNIRDRDAAKEWMRNAVQLLSDEELMAFNDVVLGSSVALPDLAGTLADAWRSVSDDDSVLRGNVALEGWTRLAAGGWTAGISLRAALFERAQRVASSTAEVDIFLVRAIGAALDQWEDQELESALEMLASQEVVEWSNDQNLWMTLGGAA